MNKTLISTAVATVIGAASFSANASLTANTVLIFDEGVPFCQIFGEVGSCQHGLENVSGSWFAMDNNGNGAVEIGEKTAIQPLGGIESETKGPGIGMYDLTVAGGSHAGAINGSETPTGTIWEFFGGTGLNYLTSAMVDLGGDGLAGGRSIDMSGWTVGWNGIAGIPMGGDTANFGAGTDWDTVEGGAIDTGIGTMTCSTSSCSQSSTFVLDYFAHVPLEDESGFGGVGYTVHLEGVIGVSAVPVPAAVWLFGSGLLGLVGVARRKKA